MLRFSRLFLRTGFAGSRFMQTSAEDIGKGVSEIRAIHRTIRKYVESTKTDAVGKANINKYVDELLAKDTVRPSLRPYLYDSTISVLMQHRCFFEASILYHTLVEKDFVPSPQTTIKISAAWTLITERHQKGEEEDLQDLDEEVLEKISNPDYDEASLREMVDVSMEMGVTSQAVERMINHFIATRPAGYTPSVQLNEQIVRIQANSRNFSALEELLFSRDYEADANQDATLSHPFATLLNEVIKMDPKNPAPAYEVLRQMDVAKVPMDLSIFNIFLALQVRRNAFSTSFDIYKIISDFCKRLKDVAPNRFTYGSLFTMIFRMNRLAVQPFLRPKFRPPKNAISPRKLFSDMTGQYKKLQKNNKGTEVLDARVLTIALRTFLCAHDYAAAYVVCRTFVIHDIEPSVTTYRYVILALMKRVSAEIPSVRPPGRNFRFSERLLGIHAGQPVKFGNGKLTTRIMDLGMQASMSRPKTFHESAVKDYRMPTIGQITNSVHVPYRTTFSMTPILRILRHAIFCSIGTPGDILAPFRPAPGTRVTKAQIVSQAIAGAKAEMVAPEVAPEPEKQPISHPEPFKAKRLFTHSSFEHRPRQNSVSERTYPTRTFTPDRPYRTSYSQNSEYGLKRTISDRTSTDKPKRKYNDTEQTSENKSERTYSDTKQTSENQPKQTQLTHRRRPVATNNTRGYTSWVHERPDVD